MECGVEYTDEFEEWWESLCESEQEDVAASVELLERRGVNLPFPYSSGIKTKGFDYLRELRIQHQGDPYRVLYAFDPRRMAILLIGGDKTGDKRWYDKFLPVADRLYKEHLRETACEASKE